MWSVRENIAGDKGIELKDVSVYKYARKRKKTELNKRKTQTSENTEAEIKSVAGHCVQKKQEKKKRTVQKLMWESGPLRLPNIVPVLLC